MVFSVVKWRSRLVDNPETHHHTTSTYSRSRMSFNVRSKSSVGKASLCLPRQCKNHLLNIVDIPFIVPDSSHPWGHECRRLHGFLWCLAMKLVLLVVGWAGVGVRLDLDGISKPLSFLSCAFLRSRRCVAESPVLPRETAAIGERHWAVGQRLGSTWIQGFPAKHCFLTKIKQDRFLHL